MEFCVTVMEKSWKSYQILLWQFLATLEEITFELLSPPVPMHFMSSLCMFVTAPITTVSTTLRVYDFWSSLDDRQHTDRKQRCQPSVHDAQVG